MTIGMKIVLAIMAGGLVGGLLAWFNQCTSGTCPLLANPWRGALIGGLLGGLLLSSQGLRAETGTLNEHVRMVRGEEQFKELVLKSELPVLVDFHADWCGPCKRLAPILAEIAGEQHERISVVKVDADDNPELVRRYQVRGLPHLIIFRQGRAAGQLVGLRPKSALEKWIDDTLKEEDEE